MDYSREPQTGSASQTGSFSAPDGLSLSTRTWASPSPRAVVVLHHGYGEHSGRYEEFGSRLAATGIEVQAIDCLGHGLSPGWRGRVNSFQRLVSDFGRYIEYVLEQASVPVFVMGHSMGGIVGAWWGARCQATPVAGLILSSPALLTRESRHRILVWATQLVAALAPRLPTKRIGAGRLSHDDRVAPDYLADPLNYVGRIPARTASQIIVSGRRALDMAPDCEYPLYLFCGSNDTIALPAGVRTFHERAGSETKTLRIYNGLYHETLNERGKEEVISDLIEWIGQGIDASHGHTQ